jgi:hypothetical protein
VIFFRAKENTDISIGGGAGNTLRSSARIERLWRWGRWGLLAVLVLSFATFVLRFFPGPGSTDVLVQDIRAGRTVAVQVDSRGDDVLIRWHTGIITEREYRVQSKEPGGTDQVARDVIADIRRQAGPRADNVTFRDYDASYGAGGLGMLWPTTYVFLTPWTWLIVAAVSIGLIVLWRALWVERHRKASGPAWALACLLTGFGFFAYLWAEPGGTGRRPPHWVRAYLSTLATAMALVVFGVLLLGAGRL